MYSLCKGSVINNMPTPTKAGAPILFISKYTTVKNWAKNVAKSFIAHILVSMMPTSFVIKVIRFPKFVSEDEEADSFSAFLYKSDFSDACIFVPIIAWKTAMLLRMRKDPIFRNTTTPAYW